MINSVTIVGRLTKQVELRYTPNGKAVASFTVASNRPFKNNGQQEADFINCVQFGKGAENVANYTDKGSLVGVKGRIQTRSYDNSEGNRIFVTEVVSEQVAFLDSKKNDNKPSDSPVQNEGTPVDISDDDLPF
jgi:single-strand DNA-binding protein